MKKYRCGLLFGSFDPLHSGHIRLIAAALSLCETIDIVIDSDELIEKEKYRRPLRPAPQRKVDIEALTEINPNIRFAGFEVSPNHERAEEDIESMLFTKEHVVEEGEYSVLIKGDDWKGKGWDGENLGVPVLYLPYTKGISSTMFHEAKI